MSHRIHSSSAVRVRVLADVEAKKEQLRTRATEARTARNQWTSR